MTKKYKKKKKTKSQNRGSGKDHYTIVCYYKSATSYTPFYGNGEALKKFVLKVKREKYEGKLPNKVKIQLLG